MSTKYSEPISVVVPYSPSHTPRKLLEEALESIDEQSVETEPIVIEDQEGHGPAWARNNGIEVADTPLVAFLDADDYWEPEKLERQVSRMEETEAGLCVEGTSMGTAEFIEGLLLGPIESLTSSILIDTEQVDVRFEEDLDRLEDHLFMIEAATTAEVCFCDDLVVIRKHESGLSAEGTPELMFQSAIDLAEILEARVPEARPYLDEFLYRAYYREGRRFHLNEEYREAIPYLMEAFRARKHPKPLAVSFLCLLGLIWNRFRGG